MTKTIVGWCHWYLFWLGIIAEINSRKICDKKAAKCRLRLLTKCPLRREQAGRKDAVNPSLGA
ncbi:hypothetical protein, partial [Yersinia enterocolitica]